MAEKITIIVRKFPDDFNVSSMLSCEDPDYSPWPKHEEELERAGWCPRCGEASRLSVRTGDYWTLGIANDGELVVAYRGAAGNIYVFNYERFKERK